MVTIPVWGYAIGAVIALAAVGWILVQQAEQEG